MTHTTTEERRFSVDLNHPLLQASVTEAEKQLAAAAKKQGFEYEIPDTFELTVTRTGRLGAYRVVGTATYAKIVLVPQEAEKPEVPPEPTMPGPVKSWPEPTMPEPF